MGGMNQTSSFSKARNCTDGWGFRYELRLLKGNNIRYVEVYFNDVKKKEEERNGRKGL